MWLSDQGLFSIAMVLRARFCTHDSITFKATQTPRCALETHIRTTSHLIISSWNGLEMIPIKKCSALLEIASDKLAVVYILVANN